MTPKNKKEEGSEKDPNQGPDESITRRMTSSTPKTSGPVRGKREEFLPSEPYPTRAGNIRTDH